MVHAEVGDAIDVGNGLGIVRRVVAPGVFEMLWMGGGHSVICPDYRAAVDRGYWGRLVEEAESSAPGHRRRRSGGATRQ